MEITHPKRDLIAVFVLGLAIRALTWFIFPLDWNWDSYHHWQISWLSLNIGFPRGRLWDLNGCEYYWGIFPHVAWAWLLGFLQTASIQPIRLLNIVLGALNAVLVCVSSRRRFGARIGVWTGALFAIFPVASVFDVLALQDTMALTFLLASLVTSTSRPFWSGVMLALAGQCRTELLLVSGVLVFWISAAERLSTARQPMLIGWAVITGVSGWYTYFQTGNPVYGLYWSLVNVFTGGRPVEAPFLSLMSEWISSKLNAWPTKPTGIAILLAAAVCLGYFFLTLFRRPKSWQTAYFLTTAAFSLPIFLTYVGSDSRSLLIQLRAAVPLVALGIPFIVALILRHVEKRGKFMFFVSILMLIGLPLTFTLYQPFEAEASVTQDIAARAMNLHNKNTIVCDYPMMNYVFAKRGQSPMNILGNHYAPQSYGETDPMAYVRWLRVHNVTLWIRYGSTAEGIYQLLDQAYPGLLVERICDSDIRVYLVDRAELDWLCGWPKEIP